MHTLRPARRQVFLLSLCLLSLLLAACGGASTTSGTSGTSGNLSNFGNGQPGSPGQNTPNTQQTRATPMPQTRTDCPSPALTGRKPVMRSMMQGTDPAVVYIDDQGTSPDSTSFGELKLYNAAAGAHANSKVIFGTSVLVHLPGVLITEAQVSNDGQWLLFVTRSLAMSQIQMVRVDGQGLQTLYCAPPGTVHDLQWSPDASRFLFSQASVSGLLNLYLFDMATGTIQPELVQSNSATLGYEVRTWFDNQRVYVVGVMNPASSAPTRGLFALDTSKGPNQQPSNLVQIISPSQDSYCRSFDSDYNATVLITSKCSQTFPTGSDDIGVLAAPSSLVAQGVTGGSQHTIFTSRTQAVTQVRMLGYSSTNLLMTVNNLDPRNGPLSASSTPNGLWKVNTDGSGLTNLYALTNGSECSLNQFTQYPWANLSRDNRLYALAVHDVLSKSQDISLLVGSLSGGSSRAVTFEQASANLGMLAIVGWINV